MSNARTARARAHTNDPSIPSTSARHTPDCLAASSRTRTLQVGNLFALLALALAMVCGLPSPALAEQRTSDIILGTSAEERGTAAADLPDIIATHALVMSKDGTVYYERDADAPIKIASVTKVMTALVALENSSLTDVITVDHAAATVGESAVGLKEGDTLTMEEALTGLLVMSGNDTATAIATAVGAKIDPSSTNPYQTFVDAMNKKATELGCKDTLFENPHGLDFGSWVGNMHSTARDVATIYAAAMKNDNFRSLDDSDRTTMQVTSADGTQRTITLTVRNKIQGQQGNIGGKTGSTYEAGECFMSAFSRETGGEIYIAVFGSDSDEHRFTDTLALANWYYNHLAQVPFANTPSTINGSPIIAEAPCTDWTDKTVGLTLEDPAQTVTVFSLAGTIEQDIDVNALSGNIKKGQQAGTITYQQAGKTVGTAKLVCTSGQTAPNPLEWVMIQFDRAVRFFQGKAGTAQETELNEAPDPTAYDAV